MSHFKINFSIKTFSLLFLIFSINCSDTKEKLSAPFKSTDKFGVTSLYKVSSVPVFNVCELDDFRLMEISLHLVSGANVNKRNQDWKRETPIFGAVKFKNNLAVKFLLSQNADPRIRNVNGQSAIDLAQEILEKEPHDKAILEICHTFERVLPKLELEDGFQDMLDEKSLPEFEHEIKVNSTLKTMLPETTIERFKKERLNHERRRGYDSDISSEESSDVDVTYFENGKKAKRENIPARLKQIIEKLSSLPADKP
jgi:hypothetical protein